MTTRIGIRDLRNRTSEMIELAAHEGEVIITSHGESVAVLRPTTDGWRLMARRLLAASGADSGLAAMLADDDEASLDDVTLDR